MESHYTNYIYIIAGLFNEGVWILSYLVIHDGYDFQVVQNRTSVVCEVGWFWSYICFVGYCE